MNLPISEKQFTLIDMSTINLDFLVEAIAKALCFEKYIAMVEAENPEDIEIDEVIIYFNKHENTYLNKAQALLVMVEQSEELLNETFH
jgi:hypothetical protein